MYSTEALFDRATAAYEWGRARWAVASALPLAAVPLASFAVDHRLVSSVVLGVPLLAVGIGLLWRGQAFGRGLGLGVKAGFVPLVMGHAANLYGHVCTASGCTSLCLPACVLGGSAAGLIVAIASTRSQRGWHFMGSGAATATLIGAFGCSCVGFGGIAGLVAGMGLSLTAARLWRAADA